MVAHFSFHFAVFWRRLPCPFHFMVYTSIGYGFDLGRIELTPHFRYSFVPFSQLHQLAIGLSMRAAQK